MQQKISTRKSANVGFQVILIYADRNSNFINQIIDQLKNIKIVLIKINDQDIDHSKKIFLLIHWSEDGVTFQSKPDWQKFHEEKEKIAVKFLRPDVGF